MMSGPGRDAAALPDLERFTFPSVAAGPVAGSAVMIHGHGDHASRYAEILLPFRQRGIACVATDLPGHGLSPGRRGAIPSPTVVDTVLAGDLERARSLCPNGPVGLLGHSAGGLLALRELLRRPDAYSFAWISSPLLWPERRRHPLLVSLLLVLGKLLPALRVSTGVKAEMCWHQPVEEIREREENSDAQFHHLITLGWARHLVEIAREVRDRFPRHAPPIPMLFTQGTLDPVCSAPLLRAFVQDLDRPDITHAEFEGLLHEPFADPRKEEVTEALANWFEGVSASLV